MSMLDWAKQECRIACKRENPKFDFDNEKDWDYGCIGGFLETAVFIHMVEEVKKESGLY